ncbi:Exopolyphosphatase [Coniothyrium glycines]
MPVPRTSLRGFLAQARDALRAAVDTRQKITIVIGNESADLDSMSSSILYAYIRSMSPPKGAFSPVYVPVTNLRAADIQLRPEYLAVFKSANIDSKHLITLDDLPPLSEIRARLDPKITGWVLVDHNVLQGQLGQIYGNRVAGVIDHHDDERKIPANDSEEPRIIEKSGSCTSLVANYAQPSWDRLSGSASASETVHMPEGSLESSSATPERWDADIAQLGLASILIDTANLNDESKTTEHDRKAVAYLEAKIMLCPELAATFNRTRLYQEIDAAKKDIGRLLLHDILRKDYKEWEQSGQKLGISSVVKPIAFLQEKARNEASTSWTGEPLLDALRDFAKQRGLDVYCIMTTSTSSKSGFQRELLVWGFTEAGVAAMKRFEKISAEELGLEDWHESGELVDMEPNKSEWRKIWWQRQVQHSRKRVAPLLREAMA